MSRAALLLAVLMLAAGCPAPAEDSPDAAESGPDAAIAGADAASAGLDAALPGPDAGPASSHGQGGLACASTGVVSSGGANYSYCVATVAGVEMKIVEPEPGTGPLRLAVYLHGDGAAAARAVPADFVEGRRRIRIARGQPGVGDG